MPGVRQTSYNSSNLMSIHPNLQSLLSLKPGFLPHFMKKEILPSSYDIYLKDCPSRGGVLLAVASHIPTLFTYSQSDPDILAIKLLTPSPIIMCDLLPSSIFS